MTLKLILIAAALLAISACVVRPYGEGPTYYSNGPSRERGYDSRDNGDRDYRGSRNGHDFGDERHRD
jgi:hypothetical protein